MTSKYTWQAIQPRYIGTENENIKKQLEHHNAILQEIENAFDTCDFVKLVDLITFTTHCPNDKMRNKFSLSTAVFMNKYCIARMAGNAENTVCPHCFANSLSDFKPGLKRSLARNTLILTSVIIPV